MGYALAPPGEYEGTIGAASAMRAVATIGVATCSKTVDVKELVLKRNPEFRKYSTAPTSGES